MNKMMYRPTMNRIFQLREWQKEAFRAVLEKIEFGKREFLCVATPGAGKTKFALRVAHHFMKEGLCERIVVVTPSDNLKRQWAKSAAEFSGLDIDPDFSNSQGIEAGDYHGIAITYALLGQDKQEVHAQNSFNKRTLVILDEVHHAGDSLTWGKSVKNAFQSAVFRLSISGTPFRSDDNEIPFIEYDETRTSMADYNYSYERAIRDNVCRPVYFSINDGNMKWRVGESEFKHSFKDILTPDQVSKRLKTALDVNGNYIRGVLRSADAKLTEIRRTHPEAGGLVFASTQKHAKELSQVIKQITGTLPPVVVSDEGEGNKKIDQFAHDSSRWLVSVKMVSEGVDIPRLRVGVYFTNIKAELFFRQAVGRFVRVLSHLQAQDAFVFIPMDRDIVKLAETIQEERDHALDKCEKGKGEGADQADLFGSEYVPALQGRFQPLESQNTSENIISVNIEVTTGMKTGVLKKVTNQSPVFQQKKDLRDRLNTMARRIAIDIAKGTSDKPDFRYPHSAWIEQGGKPMESETIPELEQRLEFYRSLMR